MANQRLDSLDALRGLDMLFIMGLTPLILSVCALFPGGNESWIALQMHHVPWEGLRQHDTIFPIFLFIAGMTFPFSLSAKQEKGFSRGRIWWSVIRRGLMLVFLGLVYQGFFNFQFKTLRYASVLGRIGLAWMFAAMLYLSLKRSWQGVVALAILVGYWLLLRYVPAPDAPAGAHPFSPEGNLCGYIDRLLLPGRMYRESFDPEGLLGTLPAIVTAQLGMFTGDFVRESKFSGGKKTLYLLCAGALLIVLGFLWGRVFPINKALWTSSFVVAVGGIAIVAFAVLYYLIDVRGWKKWAFPLQVVGLNSITIYLAQRIIDFQRIGKFFLKGTADLFPEAGGKVVLSLGYLVVCWLFLWLLYRKKVFLKV